MKGLIFTYVLMLGGAAGSLINPLIGLYIYISFSIIKPPARWPWSVEPGPYTRIVAIGLLIGWALVGFGRWRFGRAKLVVACFVGFWLWAVISAAANGFDDVSVNFIVAVAKILLPFLVGITLIDSVEQVKLLMWVIVLSVGFVAYEENLSYLQWGLENPQNRIAHELAMGCGSAFFLGLYSQRWWQRLLCFGLAAMMVHVPMLHMSRGAMIGVCAVGLATFAMLPKTSLNNALFAIAVATGLFLAGPRVRSEFKTVFASPEERDFSAQSRLDLWRDMLDAARKNPVTGLGPAKWRGVADEYGWPKGKDGHGLWIQLMAELGFPGGLLFLSFFGSCAIRLWMLSRLGERLERGLRPAVLGVAASLCGVLVGAQFASFWAIETPYYLVLLGACALKLADQHGVDRIQSVAHLAGQPRINPIGNELSQAREPV